MASSSASDARREVETLRAGIIGCGLAARELHLPSLKATPGVELVGVCDRSEVKAREIAAEFAVPRWFSDPNEMLATQSLDLVHVLTPPESHELLSVAAMDAGANVLIEKPFVYSVSEADRVIESSRATGRRFSVVHNELFTTPLLELKQRVRNGAIGTLVSAHYAAGRRDQGFVPDAWYYRNRGGRMGETLPHALAVLVELIDDLEVTHVESCRFGHSIPPSGISKDEIGVDEVHVTLLSRGANALASIVYSLNAQIPSSLLVCGTEASLLAHPFGRVAVFSGLDPDLRALVPAVVSAGLGAIGRRFRTPRPRPFESSGHLAQIRSFADEIRTGCEPAITPARARHVVQLWQAIFGTAAVS